MGLAACRPVLCRADFTPIGAYPDGSYLYQRSAGCGIRTRPQAAHLDGFLSGFAAILAQQCKVNA